MSAYIRALLERKRARQAEERRAEQQAEQLRRQAEAERDQLIAEAQGEQGPPGPQGPKGDKPDHEWKGTELRFEKPDGSWGPFVNLQGPRGGRGGSGGGGTGGTDLSQLPLADQSSIEQVVVRQNNQWRRMSWDQFGDAISQVIPSVQVFAGTERVLAGTDPVVAGGE